MITDLVTQGFSEKIPVTMDYLLDQIDRRFDVSVSSDTMWHIVGRMPGIKTVQGVPMDKNRIMVSREVVREDTQKVAKEVERVPKTSS
jgi:hypothetical protein